MLRPMPSRVKSRRFGERPSGKVNFALLSMPRVSLNLTPAFPQWPIWSDVFPIGLPL